MMPFQTIPPSSSFRWEDDAGVIYFCHPHHRNGNPNKSQWCITPPTELAVFEGAPANVDETGTDTKRWGLFVVNGTMTALGSLGEFIAHFRQGASGGRVEWHGYPAREWPYDVPSDTVLEMWSGFGITRAKARKIREGQLWTL